MPAGRFSTLTGGRRCPARANPRRERHGSGQRTGPAGDLLNPTNLFQLFSSVKTAPGTGPDGTLRTVTTETYKVRADGQIVLDPQWLFGAAHRPALHWERPDHLRQSRGRHDMYGLSDADAQAALIHVFDDRWKAGFGVRIYAPTGGDTFGTGKWRFMPGAAGMGFPARNQLRRLLQTASAFRCQLRRRSDEKVDRQLQFAPMLNISLPDRWFFTLYPNADIRWNFSDPITGQTGRLYLRRPRRPQVHRRLQRLARGRRADHQAISGSTISPRS